MAHPDANMVAKKKLAYEVRGRYLAEPNAGAPLTVLNAYGIILGHGASECGEIARQELMAEAIGLICKKLAIT